MKFIPSIKKSIAITSLIFFIIFLQGCASTPSESPANTRSDDSVNTVKKFSSIPSKALLAGRTFFYPFLLLKLTLPEGWNVELSDGNLQPISAANKVTILDTKIDSKGNTVLSIESVSDDLSKQSLIVYSTDLSKSISSDSKLNTISNKEIVNLFTIGLRKNLKNDGYSFEKSYFKQLGDIEYYVLPTIPPTPSPLKDTGISGFQDYYTVYIRSKQIILTFIVTTVGTSKDNQLEKIIEEATLLSAKSKTN